MSKLSKVYVGVGGLAVKPEILEKIYIGDESGLAKLIYKHMPTFGGYTGDYSELGNYTIDGSVYTIYQLTKSGTLTLNGAAKVWLCGGGAGGEKVSAHESGAKYAGGGGGGGYTASGTLDSAGAYTVVIADGGSSNTDGGSTAIYGSQTYSASGGKKGSLGSGGAGGSGGGRSYYSKNGYSDSSVSQGQGVSTYPFGITSLYAHSGGGGGGAYYGGYNSNTYMYVSDNGGRGGTNGGNGGSWTNSDSDYSCTGGAGGNRGGGKGADMNRDDETPAASATFYGSGGGGNGIYDSRPSLSVNPAGAGYQGVVYVAVPA